MSIAPIRTACRLLFWAAALFAYVCAIWPHGVNIVSYDKGNHIIAFFTLGLLARLGYPRRQALLIALGLVCFGGFIELSQSLAFIHRDADLKDVYADGVGIAGGMALGQLLLGLYRRFLVRG